MTWREITRQMLEDSGVSAPGQVPSAEYDAAALVRLNQILSDWSRDGVLPPALTTVTKVLTAGQAVYTAGTAGDITSRPLELDSVFVTGGSLGVVKYPVSIRNFITWNQFSVPSVQSIPNLIAINPGYPLASIYLFPTPVEAFTLSISGKFAWTVITLADMTTEASLPTGFEYPIIADGAYRLAKKFRISTPEIAQTASSAYRSLRLSLPYQPAVQSNPRAAALGGGSGSYNWLADQSTP